MQEWIRPRIRAGQWEKCWQGISVKNRSFKQLAVLLPGFGTRYYPDNRFRQHYWRNSQDDRRPSFSVAAVFPGITSLHFGKPGPGQCAKAPSHAFCAVVGFEKREGLFKVSCSPAWFLWLDHDPQLETDANQLAGVRWKT